MTWTPPRSNAPPAARAVTEREPVRGSSFWPLLVTFTAGATTVLLAQRLIRARVEARRRPSTPSLAPVTPEAALLGSCGVLRADHLALEVVDAEASRHFYRDLLGFREIPRPAFSTTGYWLELPGSLQMHIIEACTEDRKKRLRNREREGFDFAGVLSTGVARHLALCVKDVRSLHEKLVRAEIGGARVQYKFVPTAPLTGSDQLFLMDPDGNVIELATVVDPQWLAPMFKEPQAELV